MPATLSNLPAEIFIRIVQFCDRGDHDHVRRLCRRSHKAFQSIPFLSNSVILQRIYEGNFEPLFRPYATVRYPCLAELADRVLSSHAFRDFFEKHKGDRTSCGQYTFLLFLGAVHKKKAVFQCKTLPSICEKFKQEVYYDIARPISFYEYEYLSAHMIQFLLEARKVTPLAVLEFALTCRNAQAIWPLICNIVNSPSLVFDDQFFTRLHELLEKHRSLVFHIIQFIKEDGRKWKKLYSNMLKYSQTLSLVLADAFENERLNMDSDSTQFLCWLFLGVSSRFVDKMIRYPDLHVHRWKNLPLHVVLTHNDDVQVVRKLLLDSRVDPGTLSSEALCYAIRHEDMELFEYLLQHPTVDPSANESHCLSIAAEETSTVAMAIRLLDDGRVEPSGDTLDYAITEPSFTVLSRLLEDPRVDPNIALKLAVSEGEEEALKYLLAHPRVDPSFDHSRIFEDAVKRNRVDMMTLIAADPRVDINGGENLKSALKTAETEVIEWFLAHPRFDIAVADQSLFIYAVEDAQNPVSVELLLKDPRVDPSAQGNRAIRSCISRSDVWRNDYYYVPKKTLSQIACEMYGLVDDYLYVITNRLVQDKRVEAKRNAALKAREFDF